MMPERGHSQWSIPQGLVMDKHVRNLVWHRTRCQPSVRKRPTWNSKRFILTGDQAWFPIAYNLAFAAMNDRDAFGLPQLAHEAGADWAADADADDDAWADADWAAAEAPDRWDWPSRQEWLQPVDHHQWQSAEQQ